MALFAIDLALVLIATALAFALRENFELSPDKAASFLPYVAATAVSAALVVPALGLSRSVWRFSSMSDYLHLVLAAVAITLGSVLLSFGINRLDGVARSIPFLQSAMILLTLAAARVLMRVRQMTRTPPARQFDTGGEHMAASRQTILIVGLNRLTELYLQSAQDFGCGGIHIAGLIGRDERHTGRLMHRYPVLGVPEDIHTILSDLRVHGTFVQRIVVTARYQSLSAEARAVLDEIASGTEVAVDLLPASLGFEPLLASDSGTQGIAASPAEQLFAIGDSERCAMRQRPYWSAKRAADLLAAAVLIVLLGPLMSVIALAVLFDGGAPVLFWQQRPGLAGRPFRLYKFRTMGAAFDAAGCRIPDERRLSAFGRLLRRSRLDELPQLFNILLGQMSFIGPRPLLPADQPVGASARLQVRPGLTGWAQVKGGRHLSSLDKMALDVWYVRNACARVDAEIVLRTLAMIVCGEEANAQAVHLAWEEVYRAGVDGEGASLAGLGGELAA